MPSSYSSKLRIELPKTGELAGTWGDVTNKNLGTLLEQAVAGFTSVVLTDANYTLTAVNGALDESRAAILSVEGTALATRDVIIPAASKIYVVTNNSTGSSDIRIKTSTGAAVTIPNGVTAQLYCDGLDTVLVSSNQTSSSGTVTSITATAPLTGGTITGSGSIGLATVPGLAPGVYGNTSNIPVITIDAYGRITAASQTSITGGAGSGTVSVVNTGSGLTGGPITTTGTISLATTGVSSGTYGAATAIPRITVDSFGRITGITTVSSSSSTTSISNTGGTVSTLSNGISMSATGNISMSTTGSVIISGSASITESLAVTQQATFLHPTMRIDAGSITTEGDTRFGTSSQTFRVGSDGGQNKMLVSSSGSNQRGVMWDGASLIVGRGVLGSSTNILFFSGDTSGGTATFTASTIFKPGGGSFAASSDERLKRIHRAYDLGLDALAELNPILFSYNDNPQDTYIGLSAQKTKATRLGFMVTRGEDGYLRIDNSPLVYTLTNAVNELNRRLTTLENTHAAH